MTTDARVAPTPGDERLAALPYAPPRRSAVGALRQYATLVRMLLAEYRQTWFFHAFFGGVLPLGFVFFLKTAAGALDRERAIFLLGGNLAAALTFGPTVGLITKLGWWRQNRELEYWVALPLPKVALVLALVSVALLLALPGLVGVFVVGSLLLGLPLGAGLGLLPLLPLGTLSLAGVGALVGSYARDGPTASLLSNLLIVFVGFLSPTMLPPEALPAPLRAVGWLLPTTYVADAFRAVLGGRTTTGLAVDIAALTLLAIACLALVERKLDWRAA